jgi:Zn finger protein HypA/HybF involved in hydrogenase expression
MVKVKVQSLECLKCGHRWIPRQSEVRQCPSCKSPRWDIKR